MPEPADSSIYGIVYKAENTKNGKVYIGITKKTLEHRRRDHIRLSRALSKFKYYFHHALAKYGPEVFVWSVLELCTSAKVLNERERFYIKRYQSNLLGVGYNLTAGGEGALAPAASTLAKKSRAMMGHPVSAETRKKISSALWGKTKSLEARVKTATANTGKRPSEETRKKMSQKHKENKCAIVTPVVKIGKNGEILARFVSIAEAARQCGLCKSAISSACRGVIKSCGGYAWEVDKGAYNKQSRKQVLKLDKERNVVAVFSSAQEAAEKCNLSSTVILHACCKELSTYGGWLWKYGDEISVANAPVKKRELANYGRKLSEETKDKIRQKLRKPVLRVNSEGVVLERLSSAQEAGEKYGLSPSNITAVCNRHREKCGGWCWCFELEKHRNCLKECVFPAEKTLRPVFRIDEAGSVLESFSSLTEAAKKYCVSSTAISYACSGKTKTCKGFMWRYAEVLKK